MYVYNTRKMVASTTGTNFYFWIFLGGSFLGMGVWVNLNRRQAASE